MARGWHYTKLSLSSTFLLSFSGMCTFCRFCFVFVFVFLLSLELCRCSSDLFLSSRPRTKLATTYNTGYMVEARTFNVKKTTI